MRTTLELDDRVLSVARAIARDRGLSLGAAVSELAQLGLSRMGPIDVTGGFPTFSIEIDAAPLTLDDVNAHRD
ncbi:antitoxin [Microbacterium invictum]|uniref:Antitoxin VapB39 n=1 Tax=Microbacterium invictum TaxID=515415 RepID=A0AA40SPP0_9MICO|nr:antitoxin [Microbacterium invictum]MBB4140051.1 hypothetical protein [Microbacterium invictum]